MSIAPRLIATGERALASTEQRLQAQTRSRRMLLLSLALVALCAAGFAAGRALRSAAQSGPPPFSPAQALPEAKVVTNEAYSPPIADLRLPARQAARSRRSHVRTAQAPIASTRARRPISTRETSAQRPAAASTPAPPTPTPAPSSASAPPAPSTPAPPPPSKPAAPVAPAAPAAPAPSKAPTQQKSSSGSFDSSG